MFVIELLYRNWGEEEKRMIESTMWKYITSDICAGELHNGTY
jgi:hypothetical protein